MTIAKHIIEANGTYKAVFINKMTKTYCFFSMHLNSCQLGIQVKSETPSLGVVIQ